MLQSSTTTGRATWREWVGLALLTLPLFMMATDITVLFLAMPELSADLRPSTTQMLWILHIGEFVAAGLVITLGRLTDKIGRRQMLLISMALYATASALAAFAPSPELLIVARVLIGAAAAGASPAAISLLRSMFTDAKQFGLAFAVLMGSFSVGAALGPPIGGVLLENFWWGSVFLVNIPAALVLLLLGRWILPTFRDPAGGGVDGLSVGLSIMAVIGVIYGLQEIADQGFSLRYLAAILVGLTLGALFLRRQRRLADPLLDLGLLRYRALSVSLGVLFGASLAFMAVDLMLVQYLQVVAQVPLAQLGLLLAAPGAAAIVGTMLAPVMMRVMRPGPGLAISVAVAGLGAVVVVAGIAFAGGSLAWLVTGTTIVGLGSAPVFVIAAQLVVTSAPPEQSGSAAAVQDVSAGLGGAMGMALIGSAAMVAFGHRLRADAPAVVGAGELEAAGQSVGGAVAVADSLDGAAGRQMLAAVQHALAGATQVAYLLAIVLTVLLVALALVGLRGVLLPGEMDDGEEPVGEGIAPEADLAGRPEGGGLLTMDVPVLAGEPGVADSCDHDRPAPGQAGREQVLCH